MPVVVRSEPVTPPSTQTVAAATRTVLGMSVAAVTPIHEGLNAVYRVTGTDGKHVVLKAATVSETPELLAEARCFRLIADATGVPVPEVLATVDPADWPLDVSGMFTPYCEGRTVPDLLDLPPKTRERLIWESGQHLGAIHGLRVTDRYGPLRVVDGDLVTGTNARTRAARFEELVSEAVRGLRGEGYMTDDHAPFSDLAAPIGDVLTADALPALGNEVPVVLSGDYRPANLILGKNDADPVIRAIVDLGGCESGDGLLDLALTEDALVDVPMGGTSRASQLRSVLRDAYRAAREDVPEPGTDPRYPYYRLYARTRRLAAFGYWSSFAREDDQETVARRWRRFVRSQIAELE